jgi:PTS system beta-glucosides-specific IIC component
LRYFISACIGAGISIVITFIATLILYRDTVEVEEETKELEQELAKDKTVNINGAQIVAPIKGQLKSLKMVDDGMFSEEILGQGVAIQPEEGKVVSPVDGVVSALFDSKHAIGITSDDGLEILIHVGIDTVQLNGEGYEYHVEKGQKITVGDELITFDLDGIQEKGYKVITPVVITNSQEVGDILTANEGAIDFGAQVIRIMS